MASAHPHPVLRAALALFVLASAAGCSPDLTVAPDSPSFASATPIHQEPGIPQEEPPPVPAPPEQCMDFDPDPPAFTRWGSSAGTPKGPVIHAENNIRLSLRDYLTPATQFVPATGTWTGAGTGTTATVAHYGDAVIDTVTYGFLAGHTLRLDSVGAAFDFRATPPNRSAVSLRFVDLSPVENMAVDDSAGGVHVGQIWAWPDPQANRRVKVELKTDPTAWPTRGTVTIYGPVNWVRVGGAKDGANPGLWLDFICYHLPQGSLVPPNPL